VVGNQVTIQFIAIGIGCRLGCSAEAIEGVIRLAMERVPGGVPTALFTVADKRGEVGMIAAALALNYKLVFLQREALRAQVAAVETRSPASEATFGVPSVAEAAALAGCGGGAVLLVPRIARAGATCAVAGLARTSE
jgi:cobalamin biosynthesis protein CbiG